MGVWIKILESLSVTKVLESIIESSYSFLNCSPKVLVFGRERRVQNENYVGCSFTNGNFWAI